MELRDLLDDPSFMARTCKQRDSTNELGAVRRLAHVFAKSPEGVLQELVDIAVEFCGADSAGISLEELSDTGEFRFRWVAIAGSFAPFLNGTTPRFFSPCGTCLSSGRAQLYRVTKPYYDFLGVEAEPITDGMLIPWINESVRGTIWAVSQRSHEAFDVRDYRLLENLADFASITLRYQVQQEILRKRERDRAYAERTNEMAHQINNPLQSLTNSLYLARSGGPDAEKYLDLALAELAALSDMAKKLLSLKDANA